MTNITLGFFQGKSFSEAVAGSDGTDASVTPEVAPNLESYSDPAVAGGGQIYSQASHILSYIGFITGLAPVEISARFDNAGTAVDAINVLHLQFEKGALGSVATAATLANVERMFEVRVVGDKGILSLELWHGHMRIRLGDGTVETPDDLDDNEIYPKYEPARNLVDLVLGKAKNGSPASLGHYAMRLIEAACESATGRHAVKL